MILPADRAIEIVRVLESLPLSGGHHALELLVAVMPAVGIDVAIASDAHPGAVDSVCSSVDEMVDVKIMKCKGRLQKILKIIADAPQILLKNVGGQKSDSMKNIKKKEEE